MRDSFDSYYDGEPYTEEELCAIDKLYETNPILCGSAAKCDFPPLVTLEEQSVLDQIYSETDFPPLVTPEEQEMIDRVYTHERQLKLDENAWIQTYTGKKFCPLHIKSEDICIEDIAHALSLQCRFSGHCNKFYSVAQHSVLVSSFCSESERLHGLLHDASEAYIADICAPLKCLDQLTGYRELEAIIQTAIYSKFRLDPIGPSGVKRADQTVLSIEARSLMSRVLSGWQLSLPILPLEIIPLLPTEAENLFLSTFCALIDKDWEKK